MTRKDLKVLALLWSIFLVRGLFYAAVLPIWEGYDEPYHFAYIQHLVATHTTPTLETPISRQVDASLHVLPLPWMLKSQAIPKPLYAHDDFWKLLASEREVLRTKFESIPPEWAREPSPERVLNYEAQQPPLYYVLSGPVIFLLSDTSFEAQVFALRFGGVVFASFAIPLAYLLITRIVPTRIALFSILGLTVIMPELYIDLVRVSNETVAIVLYTALLYALVRFLEQPPRLAWLAASAVLVGLGLLTKAYFATSVPALLSVIAISFWCWPRHRLRLIAYSLVAVFLVVTLAGPWYFRVHHLTGSWSGLKRATVAPHSALELVRAIRNVNWIGGILSIIISHIWFGAWSFLKVGRRWYIALGTIDLLSVLGILVFVFRKKYLRDTTCDAISANSLFVVISVYGFFCIGLAYDILLTYVSVGASSSTGWYMYCLIAAEATLLYVGLQALMRPNVLRFVIFLLTSAYAVLDLYGTHFLLMPYYTGLISHDAFDQVRPTSLAVLVTFGPRNLVKRLLLNKPGVLTATLFIAVWLAYIMATVVVPVFTWRVSFPDRDL